MLRVVHVAPALGPVAALALLLGCSGSRVQPVTAQPPAPQPSPQPVTQPAPQPGQPQAADTAPDRSPAVDAGVVARPGQPLRIPVSGPPAPWLEQIIAGEPKKATYTADKTASGARSAIVRTDVGQYVGFHADRGAVGVLAVPDGTVWLGFGTDDVVFAADGQGQLYAAASVAAAVERAAWQARGRAPMATDWDAAPGVIAASDGANVWVSTDEGRSFRQSRPVKGSRPGSGKGRIAAVLVRTGPTVVLTVPDRKRARVWISTDGGERFVRSRLRPAVLDRTGPWIWNQSWPCPALLSSDDQTWIEPTEKQVLAVLNTWGWIGALQTTDRLDGLHHTPDWATPTYPPVPGATQGKRRIRGANPCPPPKPAAGGDGILGGVPGGVLGGMVSGPTCTGISCLRSDPAAPSPTTRTGFFMLRDAQCAPHKDPFTCPRDKPPLRLPHTAVVDQVAGTMQTGSLPRACFPARMWSVRGLGVLLCRGSGQTTDVWVTDGATGWTREHTIDAAAETVWHVSSAADGTVLLQRSCPPAAASCSATVRRPVAVGSGSHGARVSAWFDITEKGALTHRPVVGGRVLALVERDGQAFLSLAASHLEHVVLVRKLEIAGNAYKLAVEVDGKLRIDSLLPGKNKRSLYIGAAGEAHPAEAPKPDRGPDGVIRVTPTPFDPSHLPQR